MNKTVRVLETIRQGKIGGGESHVLSLVSHIDKSRFTPIILSFGEGEMVDILNEMGIKVYVIPTTKPFNPFVIKKICTIISEENIQLIHAHGTRATSNSFYAAEKMNIPILYTVHAWSYHPSLPSVAYKARQHVEKFLTKRVTRTICVSHVNQNEGKELFKLQNSSVIVNGVDTKKFNYLAEFSDIRKELGIPENLYLVGYIVRMTEQKDPMTLLKAIKEVVSSENNIGFLLVGDGELRPEMELFIKENSLENNLFFEKFRQDIPRVLSSIDLYLLPSLWEGLPIGLLEAMAMQKKVIASDAEANRELIVHGENGLIFPRRNVSALATAIIEMYQTPEKAHDMAVSARKLVYQKYNVNTMVQKIEQLYQATPQCN